METNLQNKAATAAWQFQTAGQVLSQEPYGNGHINDTFLVVSAGDGGVQKRYILQRVNKNVFKNPVEVMENIVGVTDYLRASLAKSGPMPDMRDVLRLVPTQENKPYHIDADGQFWRMYDFVEQTVTYETLSSPEMFYYSARSFGTFFTMLAGYPATTLHETIPGFHNTPQRLGQLEDAVAADKLGRAAGVQAEIAFARARFDDIHTLYNMQQRGELPTRVTHNDTKLNNVLLDDKTGRGACVIDLDTVMPGLCAYDFGDSIRFGASTCAEDERDLSKCGLSLPMYEAYVKGFLECAGGRLTEAEVRALPMGAKLMTLECGMRFLADHLNGDVYFKIHRDGHNLDRCRTQFGLVAAMEAHWPEMNRPISTWLANNSGS